jgi:UDP-N-acetylglucosamine--N-acetylmuramyl-(pentapeptide) pyrophosphoryl-undecaprenol N-acetylglucosamine transferase
MKQRIILTGGGTAGHVMPHLAILSELLASNFEPHYIGSGGIEKNLCSQAKIPFYRISTGKLRRYMSLENLFDFFRIFVGMIQSILILCRLRPAVVFSKGGFVAVPVTISAWLLRIPVVTHESDYSPGLANKIIARFAKKILYTFPETGSYLPSTKALHVGTPVREELLSGLTERGRSFCGFTRGLPILLVMGGSQGAQRINTALLQVLPDLLKTFEVVHLTGKGKSLGVDAPGYKSFEFLEKELADVFAAASIVISRAGANSIFELLALQKPMLLIPLEAGSRGDQILNAKSFVSHGWATSISESDLSSEQLLTAINDLWQRSAAIRERQREVDQRNVPRKIVDVLQQQAISE